jgi:hypothetical protein
VVCEVLGGVRAVTLAVRVLELEAVDEMSADGAAAEKVDKEGTGVPTPEKTAGEAAETAHARAGASCESGDHGCASAALFGRHDASSGLVALGNDEGHSDAHDEADEGGANHAVAMLPEHGCVGDPVCAE